jgi:hypothetical protein
MLGTRVKTSRIKLPEKLQEWAGAEELVITHTDEGMNGNEVAYWLAYYQLKADEEKKANK